MTATYQNYLDQKISFALYPEIMHTEARIFETSFQDFLKKITTPTITSSKNTLLIGPYLLKNQKTRASKNVEAITLLVFDLDATYGRSFEQLVELFSGNLGIIHSTWSHEEQEPRYRLFLLLKNPISVENYSTVRENFLCAYPELSKMADPACKDPARAYYIFSHPQERAEIARCAVLTGTPVDPNQYLTVKHAPYFEAYEPKPLGPKNDEEKRLLEALNFLSADVSYGSGRFYDSSGKPEKDYWLAAIWAIASQGWGKEIARQWSKKSKRYSDSGFEQAWNSYNPKHPYKLGIGSLYKRAKELAQITDKLPKNDLLNDKKLFTLLTATELTSLPPTQWVVKNILPEKGLAAIFGKSGTGKSFLAMDLLLKIACGTEWFGHKVKNRSVLYIALEGRSGLSNRIRAWEKENLTVCPNNFKIILENFNLTIEQEVNELANVIVANQMENGVTVIDTLAQSTPGSDENLSSDMSLNINHLKILQERTNGLLIIVHHSGKDGTKGLRGHSSLRACLDASLEVSGDKNKRAWALEKSKDSEDQVSYGFKLKVIELGRDSDDEIISSCVIERDHSIVFANREPSGSQQKAAFKVIKQVLSNVLSGQIAVEFAINEVSKSLAAVPKNKRTNRARAIVNSLITGGFLSSTLIADEGIIKLA